MPSADFTVNGSTPTDAVAVSASSTVNLALINASGADIIAWSIVGNHSPSATNPTITPAGSPVGATASFTMPSGSGQSYIVQCQIQNGVDANNQIVADYTKTYVVGVINSSGFVPIAAGETLERSATHGYTETINDNLGGSGGTDADAIHASVAAEISGITEKVTPVSGDFLLIEDSAAANAKKRVQIGNLPGGSGTDANAIHDNVAAEISAITAKATPTTSDFLLIEDAADANNKKRITVGDLPAAAPAAHTHTESEITDLTHLALTASAPANVTKAAAAVGVATDAARADHKHDVTTAAPATTGVGTASGEGSATTLARSDHSHQSNTAPVNVTKAAAAIGTSGEPARADHKHDITTAAPAATGVATASGEGSATTLARSDHTHQSNTAPVDVTKAAAAIGTSGQPARADHKHDVSTAAAVELTDSTNAEGAATTLARSNHTHAHGNRGGGTLHAVAGASAGFMPGNYYDTQETWTTTATTSDGDNVATGTTLGFTPRLGRFPRFYWQGQRVVVGGLSAAVYFSSDGGTTARTNGTVASGDTAHWNGSVAGFELAAGEELLIEGP